MSGLRKFNNEFGEGKRGRGGGIWRSGSFGFVEEGEMLDGTSGTSEVVSFRRAVEWRILNHHGYRYASDSSETPLGLIL